jgi:hypothetical protein
VTRDNHEDEDEEEDDHDDDNNNNNKYRSIESRQNGNVKFCITSIQNISLSGKRTVFKGELEDSIKNGLDKF